MDFSSFALSARRIFEFTDVLFSNLEVYFALSAYFGKAVSGIYIPSRYGEYTANIAKSQMYRYKGIYTYTGRIYIYAAIGQPYSWGTIARIKRSSLQRKRENTASDSQNCARFKIQRLQ